RCYLTTLNSACACSRTVTNRKVYSRKEIKRSEAFEACQPREKDAKTVWNTRKAIETDKAEVLSFSKHRLSEHVYGKCTESVGKRTLIKGIQRITDIPNVEFLMKTTSW
ncbi:hypothetical protein TSAR_014671, partial [Trichomalopsis sarcophagae]